MKAMLRLTIPHQVAIPLSGAEIADLFWDLDDHEQAEFFNQLAKKDRLALQLQAVTDSENLTIAGRVVMNRIGEYSNKNTI
jgi:hypothetical protein